MRGADSKQDGMFTDEPSAVPHPGDRCRSAGTDGPQAGESVLAKRPFIDRAGASYSRSTMS
jgi:hypothetical protein